MGFKIGMNIGGPWLKRVTPKKQSMENDFRDLLKLDFDALIAAHGKLITTGAKTLITTEMENRF